MPDIYIISEFGKAALPILPENMPEISQSADNEEFNTYDNGTFNIPSKPGLKEFSLEVLLPNHKYGFAKNNVKAAEILEILEKSLERQKPLRVIMAGKRTTNAMFLIESMSSTENRQGDINLTADFKEYRKYD